MAETWTNRIVGAGEMDPKDLVPNARYCDVIVRRWEEATGRAAERIRRGGTGV